MLEAGAEGVPQVEELVTEESAVLCVHSLRLGGHLARPLQEEPLQLVAAALAPRQLWSLARQFQAMEDIAARPKAHCNTSGRDTIEQGRTVTL